MNQSLFVKSGAVFSPDRPDESIESARRLVEMEHGIEEVRAMTNATAGP